jgi:hypothetical protein
MRAKSAGSGYTTIVENRVGQALRHLAAANSGPGIGGAATTL